MKNYIDLKVQIVWFTEDAITTSVFSTDTDFSVGDDGKQDIFVK